MPTEKKQKDISLKNNKILRVAVIGCGSRGTRYARLASNLPEQYALVAAADPVSERVEQIRALSSDSGFKGYPDAAALLEDRPSADVVMVCTQDDDHFEHAMGAMEAGYDLLLEKPVSNSMEEVVAIEQKAVELRRRVVVCHVLRYSAFYLKVKQLIDDGVLGDLVSVHAAEGVGAWHFSHSFVRGHWAVMEETSPMILAKCCHDMDLLHWLIGRECRSVSSVGALNHFKADHAPAGAPERCHQGCPVADDCMYNAKHYLEESGKGWLAMVYDRARTASDGEILQWLETSPWGRCAYRCNNTAVDHQVLAMGFDGGISCSFTMTAFDTGRGIEIYGTKGRLKGGEFVHRSGGVDIIVENHQGETLEKIDFEDHGGHLGGDEGLVDSLYARMVCWSVDDVLAEFRQVVHGHRMAFAAEEARQTGTVVFS
ncbi:Putative oxidoreductase YteT [Pontiella sulfatireligans]|uniref:Oxidoreductase YteT n=1 Tax=Pontiella sulfatireligans TaxID=2750658 RepID=A0A6C2UN96_9BACT|nr:Putative oxidoreductase YteT [Pontiella sulfatireligans]